MVVAEGSFRVFTAETVTGKILADLPVDSHKWGVRLNDGGPLSCVVDCYTEEAQAMDIRNVTGQWRTCLGISYNGVVLEAGPIIDRSFNAETGKLDLTAKGLWSIFDRRKMIMGGELHQNNPYPQKSVWVMGPTSLRTIAREIVRVSIQDNPYINSYGLNAGYLPIILPSSVAGSENRTYHGYELVWMGAELRKYTQLSGGPDIRFVPRFKPGAPTYIEWVMETGTPSVPLLKGTGDPWKWDGTRDDSGVTGLSTVEDGSGMAVRSWTPGQGQENDMPLAKATNLDLLNAGGPWLEGDSAAKLEEESNILQSIANRAAADSRAPMNTISLSVRADFWPYLGNYMPGDMARVVVPPGHPTLNPGPIDVRIMAVDGTDGDTVSLTLSPVIGSLAGSPWAESMTTSVEVPAIYPSDTLYPSFHLFPSDDQ